MQSHGAAKRPAGRAIKLLTKYDARRIAVKYRQAGSFLVAKKYYFLDCVPF
jgi:hypothetical protein